MVHLTLRSWISVQNGLIEFQKTLTAYGLEMLELHQDSTTGHFHCTVNTQGYTQNNLVSLLAYNQFQEGVIQIKVISSKTGSLQFPTS